MSIFRSLDDYAEAIGRGVALPDNGGFAIPALASGRQSFSPDTAYYLGSLPSNPMRFLDGSPTFAVEVRSENDYGDAAEAEMAAKRADYFEAGTAVVWDVDPINDLVRKYPRDSLDLPAVFSAVKRPIAMSDGSSGGGARPGRRTRPRRRPRRG